jgi:signal transduction histidine kinase
VSFLRIRSRSLIVQLLALVVLPILILLMLVSFEGISLHEHAMRALVGERDERAIRAAAEVLSDRFVQRRLVLKVIADRLSDGNHLSKVLDAEPALRDAFDMGLVELDHNGTVLDKWQPGIVWSPDLRKQKSPWIVDHDSPVPMVITQTESTQGDIQLFGGLSLTSLNVPGAMGVIRNNPEIRLYLVADDGHVLEDTAGTAIGTNARDWPGINLEALPNSMVQHDQGDLITVSSRIGQLGWTLVAQEPWHAVVSSTLQLSLIAPLAMIPAVIIAVFVLLFGTSRIVLPLQRLGRAASQLAWGDYESIRQPVGGVQEVHDLHRTLSLVAQRLQQAQASMHSYVAAMLQGQEDERKRLSRELHDDTLQSLIALDQQRQMAQRAVPTDPAKTARHLEQLREMIDEMIGNLRNLIRDMRPSYIEDLGLTPALETLCTQHRESGQVVIKFQVQGMPKRLPINHELGLYRIAQEAINNAIRHGRANLIEVGLRFEDSVTLTVRDNGSGFVVPERPNVFAQNGHYGLMGMVERTEQMQGQFRIISTPGKGTDIEVRLPTSGALQSNPG